MTYSMIMSKPRRRRRRPASGGMGDALDDIFAALGFPSTDTPASTDNVNQTTGGGTSTSASDFVQIAGVCKPQNFPALEAVRELQRQLNRVAEVKRLSKTAVDGAIGPTTLGLFRQVQSAAAGSVMGDPSTCMGVAPDVDVLAAQVRDFATTLGAPATVSGPIMLTPPTIVTKSNKTVVAPDGGIAASLASMSGIEKLAILGVAGAIGYLVVTGKKRRKK